MEIGLKKLKECNRKLIQVYPDDYIHISYNINRYSRNKDIIYSYNLYIESLGHIVISEQDGNMFIKVVNDLIENSNKNIKLIKCPTK